MESITTDILILGAGAAGIRAAVAARQEGPEVLMVAADDVTYGGATFSSISNGWGIQALVGQERSADNLESFYKDIMRVGLGQSDPVLVRILVEESGLAVEDLMSYGLEFKKHADGSHFRAKGCFSGIERAFITQSIDNVRKTFLSILQRAAVKFISGCATDLIMDGGTCRGAWIVLESGEFAQINAKSTILATGGGSGIYHDHMGNGGGSGDGYALAHRAGAKLVNMEFIQFALGLKNNGTRKFLPIAEMTQPNKMIDSSGCDLLKCFIPNDNQRRESIKVRTTHMPFSCRDASGRIDIRIAADLQSGKKVYWQNGCPANDRFEVAHLAHAFNGGVKINANAESSVPGLYAAGEVAAGPHGADRIGGCMMTATQVFGKRAGQYAARRAINTNQKLSQSFGKDKSDHINEPKVSNDVLDALAAIESRVKAGMGKYTGVLRSKKGLKNCKKILNTCADQLSAVECLGGCKSVRYFKIRNIIITANLVVEAALARKESLGSHYREDDKEAQGSKLKAYRFS